MSDKIAILADGVGKQYRVGGSYQVSLRSRLSNMFSHRKTDQSELFWAVDGVSFQIKQGEVVGIIGRNGAGKSTLLKILSRITEPTSGSVEIHGRVGCLLEVGTGFHPELSGRDNVYLNGTILGMCRRDIRARFDEIVAFAEVEKFIDTAVKHYSSGMYLRLAFAVAAHLQPEILIVDEVLAVGDARFQKKCLEKMEDVSHHGRTVLFVSHSMPSITRLCPRTILLGDGKVIADGPSHQVVTAYLRGGHGTTAERHWGDKGPGNEITRLRSARVVDSHGQPRDGVDIRTPVGVEIEYEVLRGGHILVPNFVFNNEEGITAFHVHDTSHQAQYRPREPGVYVTTAWIPGNLLSEGTLIVGLAVSTMEPVTVHFYEADALAFQVMDSLEGNSARGTSAATIHGVVRPLLEWTTRPRPFRG